MKYFIFIFLIIISVFICEIFTFSILGKNSEKNETIEFTPVPNIAISKSGLLKKCEKCPNGVKCVPPIQCPAHFQEKEHSHPQICDLPANSHGYCCLSGQNHTHAHSDHHIARSAEHHDMNPQMMRGIVDAAHSQFAHYLQMEPKFKGFHRGHPEFMHNLVFHSSPQDVRKSIELSHNAIEQVLASQVYKQKENIPKEDFKLGMLKASFQGTKFERGCGRQVKCPSKPARYRTQDGTCNNRDPMKSTWGAAGSPMERLLPPSYEDGIWEPRTFSVDGSHLPNTRTISRSLIHDADRPHPKHNLLLMQFGQFITHDVTQSASITTADGKSVSCCTEDGSAPLPKSQSHYACLPIVIEPNDKFYEQFGQGCLNFVRSSLSPDSECKLGYGKQLSKVTHFLDASPVYGSDLRVQSDVRSFRNGKLRMLNDFGRELLPLTKDLASCNTLENGPCFEAGDGRANQIITLTAVHLLFAREHNRIADILGGLNPHWSDDQLFYETREIVIAKLQYIVYTEWLPHIIGSDTMSRFNLQCQHHGYSDDYSPDVNACLTSEFSTAAFRFGHSVVDGKLIVRQGEKLSEIIDIPDVMFNPGRLRLRHFYDAILNTLTHQPMQEFDSALTKGLSRFLFRGSNPFGLDLAAINIHRGRDHGVRCYNDYLEVSGRKRITSFKEFGFEAGEKLGNIYHHPDDVDLWLGGLMESASGDALVGPTFAEIIGDQFSRFRRGDSYFHEHNPDINPGHFTPHQLQEIRKSTMARIICDNSDGFGITGMAPKAFIRPDVPGNSPVSCDNTAVIPKLNYEPWKSTN